MRPFNLALVGLGTVGTGVAKIVLSQSERLARRAGRPVAFRHIVVRDPARSREVNPPNAVIRADFEGAVADPEVDVVVEVMGGLDVARRVVLSALEAGKDVVTANKALLCV